ncbi:hypothetical protein A2585_00110 [Candidatus Nomurabacteria bacterium RIFOXYD1_FULL_39_12]|nr:MAG: hypothetical protein A2585_00110 [Candidatus Nomurabacteria bacterium RIFOXYD1_FULL_39_12]
MKAKYTISVIILVLIIIYLVYLFIPRQIKENNMKNDQTSQPLSRIEELGFKKLTDLNNFKNVKEREATEAFIAELKNIRENPAEFFIIFGDSTTLPEITSDLVHQDSFKIENIHTIGNPSGKDRSATYNFDTKKVKFLLSK